jgi:hypothetical protein
MPAILLSAASVVLFLIGVTGYLGIPAGVGIPVCFLLALVSMLLTFRMSDRFRLGVRIVASCVMILCLGSTIHAIYSKRVAEQRLAQFREDHQIVSNHRMK